MFIDGSPCLDVIHTPGSEETELTCVSPPITAAAAAAILVAASSSAASALGENNVTYAELSYEEWTSTVEVVNGGLPGLAHSARYLSYQVQGE